MFCWKCGKEVPDYAKFCMNCGAEILKSSENISQNIIESTKETPVPTSQPPIQFSIRGRNLEFPHSIQEYTTRRQEFQKEVQGFVHAKAANIKGMLEKLRQDNIDDSVDLLSELGRSSTEKMIDIVHRNLLSEKIYTVSKEEIGNMYDNAAQNFPKRFDAFFEQYLEIVASDQQMKEYRAQKRAGRSYWQGGGFGVKGAIRGAAKASALNLGTSLIRSIGDSWTDSGDRAKILKQKTELLQSRKWTNYLESGIMLDSAYMFEIYADLLAKHKDFPVPSLDKRLAQVYFDNAKDAGNQTEKIDLLIEALKANPYFTATYQVLFDSFGTWDEEVLTVYEYFASNPVYFANKINKQFLQKLEAISEDSYSSLDKKIALVEQQVSYVDDMRKTHHVYRIYNELYRKTLSEKLTKLQEKRLTADDGVKAKAKEELDIYLNEKKKFEVYTDEITSTLVPLERQEELLRMAEAQHFQSPSLVELLEKWKQRCAECRKLWNIYPGSFEDYFAHKWNGNSDRIFKMLPQKTKLEIMGLPYSSLIKFVSSCKVQIFKRGLSFSLTDSYILVSNYYIIVAIPEHSVTYAIRTHEIEKIEINTKAMCLNIYKDSVHYDKIEFHIDSDDEKEFKKYISTVNQMLIKAKEDQTHNLCPACSARLIPGAAFCGDCGYRFKRV